MNSKCEINEFKSVLSYGQKKRNMWFGIFQGEIQCKKKENT